MPNPNIAKKADKKSAPDLPDWPHRGCSYPGHLVARYAALRSGVELHRPRTLWTGSLLRIRRRTHARLDRDHCPTPECRCRCSRIFLIGLLAENVLGRQLLKALSGCSCRSHLSEGFIPRLDNSWRPSPAIVRKLSERSYSSSIRERDFGLWGY